MMRIIYKDQDQYTFACHILQRADQKLYTLDAQNLTVTVSHESLGRLLARIQSQQAVLLPDLNHAIWLLTAPTLQQLEQARIHIQHLLVPAYAVFRQNIRLFQGKNGLQQAGRQIYPYGYYMLQSRTEYTDDIFQLMELWMHLEQERPEPKEIIALPTYGALHEYFQLALAAAQWDEAEQIRHEMQRRNLTSAENLHFLEIEWLARQQRWHDIWQQSDFESLSRIPIPRAVRAALLTAFHRVKLLPEEQQGNWQKALEEFSRQQPRLGLLLTARLGISQGPVVQVFAYHATHHQNRVELQELITATSDFVALECIKQLLRLCEDKPTIEAGTTILSVLKQAQIALAEENFDMAAHYAQQVDDDETKLVLLTRIAFYTRDIMLAEEAILLYWEQSAAQQAVIQQRYRFFSAVYSDLQQLIAPATSEEDGRTLQEISIKTWLDWFRHVIAQPHDPQLLTSLEKLAHTTDERFWQAEKVIELNEVLLELVVNDQLIILPYVRDAIRRLIALFLNDPAFPRPEHIYQELYDNFYNALLARSAREELPSAFLLLRLADAILNITPGKCEALLGNLREWSGLPMAKTEFWALETFELLIDYGLAPQQLVSWCREWLEWLLMYSERAQWHTWLMLSRTIQPGDDLLQQLEQKLMLPVDQNTTDVLDAFPPSYQIGIYSLREGPALRARQLLLARNSQLEVRICIDEVLTIPAKTLAQNADLVVLVTTALKHALSSGLGPYLTPDKIIYPQSSGSSSILRAIEEYARKMHPEAI